MYIMYVDESGDPGNKDGSTEHYILSGFIIKYSDWSKSLSLLKRFRKHLQKEYELPVSVEVHAKELVRINKIQQYRKIHKSNRIKILKEYLKYLPKMFPDARIINICIKKSEFKKIQNFTELAWKRLITRYDSYLKRTVRDEGIIISDDSNEKFIRNLLRKMRVFNPTPSRFGSSYNAKITRVIEDVIHRKSNLSYFIQTVDVIAFSLYNKEFPKGSLKKYSMNNIFDMLDPILLKQASSSDSMGIVRK
jgi:Protein of unknown function (DUF3800)